MTEIFISYSRQDSDFVDQLITALEKRNLSVWVDREDIRGGTAWRAAISKAIRACDTFIIVLSAQSTLSDNVTKELALADKHKKTIIPIWHQVCEIPPKMEYPLAGVHIIDFSGESFEAALAQLLAALPDIEILQPPEITPQAAEKPALTRRKSPLAFLRARPVPKRLLLLGIVGLLVVGIGLCALLYPVFFGTDNDLSGQYNILGHNFECVEYAGRVSISQSGSIYLVEGETWWMDGTPRSKGGGVGTLDGDIFTINWGVDEGQTSYRLQPDGSLAIMWLDAATSCIPGEQFTPK